MNHAIASNRLERMFTPDETKAVMQSYVNGEITWDERRELILAQAAEDLSFNKTF